MLTRFMFGTTLRTFVRDAQVNDLKIRVGNYYSREGTLDGFGDYFHANLVPVPPPPSQRSAITSEDRNAGRLFPSPHPPGPTNSGFLGAVDPEGRALIRVGETRIGEYVPAEYEEHYQAVIYEGETIAYVLQNPDIFDQVTPQELVLIRVINHFVIGIATISLLVSLIVAAWLSKRLVRPINALTHAAQHIAAGELNVNVQVKRNDELGKLATAFNQMSCQLQMANANQKQMTATIAHDLGTPLQIVYGYIESMVNGIMLPTKQRLDTVLVELGQLNRLVTDMNLLVQADTNRLSLDVDQVDVSALIDHVVRSFGPMAVKKKIEISARVEDHLPQIAADRERLIQVIGNLLNNALRYTPEAGKILIEAAAERDRVVLKVKDSGCGIPPEQLPFIFERFYQIDATETEKGMMGLGLSICKALIEAMGGTIKADKHIGESGAVFTVTLPAFS
ncbi:MAG: HAMP domain-containing sensor histidine kinase [Chloroflexota bacterium]